jgi:hypothetical protein
MKNSGRGGKGLDMLIEAALRSVAEVQTGIFVFVMFVIVGIIGVQNIEIMMFKEIMISSRAPVINFFFNNLFDGDIKDLVFHKLLECSCLAAF